MVLGSVHSWKKQMLPSQQSQCRSHGSPSSPHGSPPVPAVPASGSLTPPESIAVPPPPLRASKPPMDGAPPAPPPRFSITSRDEVTQATTDVTTRSDAPHRMVNVRRRGRVRCFKAGPEGTISDSVWQIRTRSSEGNGRGWSERRQGPLDPAASPQSGRSFTERPPTPEGPALRTTSCRRRYAHRRPRGARASATNRRSPGRPRTDR